MSRMVTPRSSRTRRTKLIMSVLSRGFMPAHRLIQHQQARPGGERPRHLKAPLLAIGKVPRDHVAAAPEPDEVEDAAAHRHGRAASSRGSPGY